MEKVITIDGKQVPLKVSGGCVRMYKLQFRRDLMKDIFKLKSIEKFIVDGEVIADDEVISKIDFEVFSDLLWTFAKKADPTIPAPMEWEDEFTSIPFIKIFPEIIELLTVLLDGTKKQVAQTQ